MSGLQPATLPGPVRLVELCYRYAYLEQRAQSRPLGPEETTEQLEIRKLLAGDLETSPGRRRHRRFRTHLPATVKGPAGHVAGFVLDISGNGLFVSVPQSEDPIEIGSTLQVRVATSNTVQYLFTGKVVRREEATLFVGLGLSLCCVPLEMRRRQAA